MEGEEELQELQELLAEPYRVEGKTSIMIQSYRATEAQLNGPSFRTEAVGPPGLSLQSRRLSFTSHNKEEQGKNICSIPSIPTNRRKYGYFEAINGILYPLVDAYQFLREGSVKR